MLFMTLSPLIIMITKTLSTGLLFKVWGVVTQSTKPRSYFQYINVLGFWIDLE